MAPPRDVASLYWLTRVTLVHQPHDLDTFDRVFEAVFRDTVLALPGRPRGSTGEAAAGPESLASLEADPPGDQEGAGLPWHTLPRLVEAADGAGDPDGAMFPELLPSDVRAVADTDFADLDAEQMALVGAWLDQALVRWPTRLSRRRRVHRPAVRSPCARPSRAPAAPAGSRCGSAAPGRCRDPGGSRCWPT